MANRKIDRIAVALEPAVPVGGRLPTIDAKIQTYIDAESPAFVVAGKWVEEDVGGMKNGTARAARDRRKPVAGRALAPSGVANDPSGWRIEPEAELRGIAEISIRAEHVCRILTAIGAKEIADIDAVILTA